MPDQTEVAADDARSASSDQPRHVGILGGGQLGAFLCRAASQLGMVSTVVSPDPGAPARRWADHFIVASLDEAAVADPLAASVDCVTFEIEDIGAPLLDALESHVDAGDLDVLPEPAILRRLQNKATQKEWLESEGVPVNPFIACAAEAIDVDALVERFGLPLVQKTQRGGYDGRGVQILKSRADLEDVWPVDSTFEGFVGDLTEVAVLVARSRDGSLAVYDPVLLEFHSAGNILDCVHAPANLEDKVARLAVEVATTAVDRLGTAGLFAVELFVLADGRVLVNEISPRVHNAGHHTLDACETSQFEQHLRAVFGLPLGSTSLTGPALMKNVLFEPGLPAPSPEASVPADVKLHWYDKTATKAWRKLGHVTATGDDAPAVRGRVESAVAAMRGQTDQQSGDQHA